MPCARIDDLRVSGVNGQRFDFVNLLAAGRADQGPGGAAIGGAVDTFEGSGKESAGIGGGLRKGVDRLVVQTLGLGPVLARIVGDPEAAAVVAPSCDEDCRGVGRI